LGRPIFTKASVRTSFKPSRAAAALGAERDLLLLAAEAVERLVLSIVAKKATSKPAF
jgi:hypothetical protein